MLSFCSMSFMVHCSSTGETALKKYQKRPCPHRALAPHSCFPQVPSELGLQHPVPSHHSLTLLFIAVPQVLALAPSWEAVTSLAVGSGPCLHCCPLLLTGSYSLPSYPFTCLSVRPFCLNSPFSHLNTFPGNRVQLVHFYRLFEIITHFIFGAAFLTISLILGSFRSLYFVYPE